MYLETLFRRAVDKPDELAVVTSHWSVTNHELWASAAFLAARLGRDGLAPGQPVGITIGDEYLHLVATIAALIAGLPQVALPTFDPVDYRRAMAERLRLAAILVENTGDGLAGFSTVTVEPPAAPAGERSAPPTADAEIAAIYITTSGTTGLPKIIPLSQRQMYLQGVGFQGEPRPERLYRPTSIEFNSSRKQRLYCLASGGINVFSDPQRDDIAEICRKLGVTELGLSATQARTLVDRSQSAPLPGDTGIRIVGSPVAARLRQEIMERLSLRLSVGYGASEFGAVSTAGPGDHGRHGATVGRPHVGVTLEIVDEDNRQVPPGTSGRIRLRSAGMAIRYHDDEALTAAAYRNGWFYPGDVGHLGEAGDLRFDGRADDMMVLASINIFPAEIERVVEAFPGVVECAAFSMPSKEFGEIPLLAVVSDGTVRTERILADARKALGLRAPRKVFVVDALPRNAAGKIVRSALRDLAAAPSGAA